MCLTRDYPNFILSFPNVKDISGDTVPMFCIFPPEDLPLVEKIVVNTLGDYFPDYTQFRGLKITQNLKYEIFCKIRSWEDFIVNCGGRKIIDELRFRLGILF